VETKSGNAVFIITEMLSLKWTAISDTFITWYFPAEHSVHIVVPVALAYLPGSQSRHAVRPRALNEYCRPSQGSDRHGNERSKSCQVVFLAEQDPKLPSSPVDRW
jgi:hypothetical protein